MVSAYLAPPSLAAVADHPHHLPNPHQNAHVHYQTQCHQQKQEFNRNNASTIANLQHQRQQLLKQHEKLSAKNALVQALTCKQNDEQKMKHEELLNQKNNLAQQILDIKNKSKQYNDCKTKTSKAFNRSTTFMMLQLGKVTAENQQAVIEEFNKNEELKTINEMLFTQLDKLTAGNAKLALESSRSNEQLLAENELLLHQSDQLAKQIAHAIEQLKMKKEQISKQVNELEQLKMKKEQISKQLNELATHVCAANKHMSEQDDVQRNYAQLSQNGHSRKRGAHELNNSTHDDICDDMDKYTKCCVCLEPYEVEAGASSSSEKRLPIKSATCSHTLCEGCVDNCFASLLANGKSNVRYVTCPQCRMKRAFDVQNKVVDFFLREYIMRRGNAVSKRSVKPKTMVKTFTEKTDKDTSISLGGDPMKSLTVSSSRKESAVIAVAGNDARANFDLMLEGAVEKHPSLRRAAKEDHNRHSMER